MFNIKFCHFRPLTNKDSYSRVFGFGIAAGYDGGRRVIQGPATVPGNEGEYIVRASVSADAYRVQDGEVVPDEIVVYACDILVDWDGDGQLESIVNDLEPDAQRATLLNFLNKGAQS